MAVSIQKAFELIYSHVLSKKSELVSLEDALGRVVYEDVIATHNLPPYDNSAMDGYAICLSDAGKSVKVINTIFAGDDAHDSLKAGLTCKIMTGARIPEGCEAIVPKEDTTTDGDTIILPKRIKVAQHIRRCGEDINVGERLLTKGSHLSAHHITLLASQGISYLRVYKKPKVALFASGNELKMHFEQVKAYQLYNTNTPTFCARARELGCDVTFLGTAHDSIEGIYEHIQSALDADLIITSGGISVGDADFTKEAFEKFNYENIFEKIEIKPGKPTTFGKIANTYVLNLPGNPLAAALNFELFAQAIILALSGTHERYLNVLHVKVKESFALKAGRKTVIPGWYDGTCFSISKKFAPGMIRPLANANAIAILDEELSSLQRGDTIKIIPTRFGFYANEPVDIFTHS